MTFILEHLSEFATATKVLQAGFGAASDSMSAQIEAANAEARAAADRFNAEVADQQAASERTAALADAEDFRRAQSARMASSRAAQAGSGFTLEGSPALVNEATMTEIEFNVGRILRQGETRATRLEQQAQLDRFSAGVETRNAGYARQAGVMSTITNAVGSFGTALGDLKPTLVNGQVQFG